MADSKANGGREYRRCSVSVLDTINHPEIVFDDAGVSQYQGIYNQLSKALNTGDEGKRVVEEYVREMKEFRKGKKYDCLLGVSGGNGYRHFCLIG